jgi:hypothetical protein
LAGQRFVEIRERGFGRIARQLHLADGSQDFGIIRRQSKSALQAEKRFFRRTQGSMGAAQRAPGISKVLMKSDSGFGLARRFRKMPNTQQQQAKVMPHHRVLRRAGGCLAQMTFRFCDPASLNAQQTQAVEGPTMTGRRRQYSAVLPFRFIQPILAVQQAGGLKERLGLWHAKFVTIREGTSVEVLRRMGHRYQSFLLFLALCRRYPFSLSR